MPIAPKLIELQKRTHNNEIEILHSKTCSCLFCRQTYDARTVNDWVNDENGMSAICPECGMDAVIGDNGGEPIDKGLLKELNLAFYGEDYMTHHPDAARKYIDRYEEGKITHKASNEALYIQYLGLLASLNDEKATYDLGMLYEFGDEFTPMDKNVALSYYASNSLRYNPSALTRLGVLMEQIGNNGKPDPEAAYECYAKGLALGGLDAYLHFADCYMKGIGVHQDQDYGFQVLNGIWEDCYQRFTLTIGKDINVFPLLCYDLGLAYELGQGTPIDIPTALRFYLLSSFSYRLAKNSFLMDGSDLEPFSDVERRIENLSEKLNLSVGDPVFDNDTFADSILSTNPSSLFLMNMSFKAIEYDEEEKTFSFDIQYGLPALIVDIGNLYCGFVPGTIRWTFSDVSRVQIGNPSPFNRIEGDADTGWRFYKGSGEESEVIAAVDFFHRDSGDNGEKAVHKKKGKEA